MNAIVALEGPLGDTVARALETACPPWHVDRVSCAQAAGDRRADVLVVDDPVDQAEVSRLGRRYNAAVLVMGRDVEKPFAIATLRSKALSLAMPPTGDTEMVAVDPPLRDALRIAEAAAERTASVLVTGPTGAGKELLVRQIHERSKRRGAFVAINCAALTDGLAESMLFGHARGAFTGAAGSVPGAFVEAAGGTLFLDEVGELDLRVQAKLLRALEDGAVRPLGSQRPRPVDIRVVAATNRDLRHEIARSTFRSDLYFRLSTFVVRVPPLCERPGDLEALIDRFVSNHERGREVRLTADARALLRAYEWPGNVRELRNVIERALSLARGGPLEADELRWIAPELGRGGAGKGAADEGTIASSERNAISEALGKCAGSRARAAAELGIHRATLWRKLKRLDARV